MHTLRLESRRVTQTRKCCGHDKHYRDISGGIWTKPIHIGSRSFWPGHENDALIAARIAGKSDEEMRALVDELHAKRAQHRVAA